MNTVHRFLMLSMLSLPLCAMESNDPNQQLHTVVSNLLDQPNKHTPKQLKEELVSCIERGADINAFDSDGYTALHRACLRGNESVTNVLLDSNADPRIKSKDGLTPTEAVLRAIRVHRTTITSTSEQDYNRERGRAVNLVLNQQKKLGQTPENHIHMAAWLNSPSLIEAFIDNGADVNESSQQGTPLHYAARNLSIMAGRALLQAKANPNALDAQDNTPSRCIGNDWDHIGPWSIGAEIANDFARILKEDS